MWMRVSKTQIAFFPSEGRPRRDPTPFPPELDPPPPRDPHIQGLRLEAIRTVGPGARFVLWNKDASGGREGDAMAMGLICPLEHVFLLKFVRGR